MNNKTGRALNAARTILIGIIFVTAAVFFGLGLSAEGLAAVALAIANIAFQQANNAERRVSTCLQINDELIQILEKNQQGEELQGVSEIEKSASGGLDERS